MGAEAQTRPFAIERRPLRSLTLLGAGLAALGVADSAEAMVADGGYRSPAPSSGKSKTSTPATKTSSPAPKAPASQPASPPTRTDASDGYAGMEASRADLPSSSDASSGTSAGPKPVMRTASPPVAKPSPRQKRVPAPGPDPEPKHPNRPPPGTKLGPGGELYPAPQPAPKPEPERETRPEREPPAESQTEQPTRTQRRANRRARRTVRKAARTVENTIESLFGAGGGEPPRPPSHPPNAADEDPYPGAPNEGPAVGDSFLDDVFGLAPFSILGEGESLSVEGGCGAQTGSPVKCIGKETGGKKGTQPARKPKRGPFAGVEVVGSAATSRGEPSTRMNGRSYSTLDVSADVRTEGSLGVDGKAGAGGKVSAKEGRKANYSVTVGERRAERIVDGELDAPDPMNPETLRQGESITLGDSRYSGSGGEISFRFFRFGGGEEEGETESAAVQRVGKDRVRISVGNEDYVQSNLEIGAGMDEANVSLGSVHQLRQGERSQIELDLSTPAGRREYRRFIGSGNMPDPEGPGRRNAATVNGWYASEGSEVKTKAGPVSASDSSSGHSESETTTDYLDSQREEVEYEHVWGDTTLQRTRNTSRGGEEQQSATSILVEEVSEDVLADALESRGVRDVPELDEASTVRLDFNNAELARLKDGAIEKYTEDYDDEVAPEEISERVRGRIPPIDMRGDIVDRFTDATSILTAAENPEDVAEELQLMGEMQGDADEWMTVMKEVDEEYGGGVPSGHITVFAEGEPSRTFTVECGRLLHGKGGD
jgi:hypothetical protein